MSVLSNFTYISLVNKTPYFLTLTCDAEQDDKFSVKSNSKDVVTEEISNQGGFLQSLFQYFGGVASKRVIVNLGKHETVDLGIRSKADLTFEYQAKVEHSFEHIPGDFVIGLSDQCGHVSVILNGTRGIGYDDSGAVCILGKSVVSSCDLLITPSFLDGDKKPLPIDEFTPSICKLSFK